jgi:hypothetical protein
MCERCCRVVGILGSPDAGKTASLVSLYLLLSRARLEGFEFCDSRTLVAFEEIGRGARHWNDGRVPQQMSTHTELADERIAGFLHLRLRHTESAEKFDFLLPDLPGEWSTSLVDNNRTDRLAFLKSADVIWFMLDGRKLIDPRTRILATHRAKLMIQRICAFLAPSIPRLLFVITRLDMGRPTEQTLKSLKEEAAAHSVSTEIVHIASFTENPEVKAGTGLSQLLTRTVAVEGGVRVEFWADDADRTGSRAMLRFREQGGI